MPAFLTVLNFGSFVFAEIQNILKVLRNTADPKFVKHVDRLFVRPTCESIFQGAVVAPEPRPTIAVNIVSRQYGFWVLVGWFSGWFSYEWGAGGRLQVSTAVYGV